MAITTPNKAFVAVFRHDNSRTTKDEIVVWHEFEDGTVTGMIIDQRDGRLRSAQSYNNFVRYEPSSECDLLIAAPPGTVATYDDHIEDVHYIQVCNGESTLLTVDPDGCLLPISPCSDCVQVQVRLPETTLNGEEQ